MSDNTMRTILWAYGLFVGPFCFTNDKGKLVPLHMTPDERAEMKEAIEFIRGEAVDLGIVMR